MCGLVGVFGDVDQFAKRAFSILHHLDVIRGYDGSGIYYHNWAEEGLLIKSSDLPSELRWTAPKEFDDKGILTATNLKLILGHNRWKTVGKVSDENAHPFEFDRVVGAHNGTIQKTSLYKFPEHTYTDEVVDSYILYAGINEVTKDGFDSHKSFQDIVNSVCGAMALTWFDKGEQTLHIYRNSQRSLYYTYSHSKDLLFWASEPWMLMVALSRCNIKHGKVEELPSDVHFVLKTKKKKGTAKVYLCEHEKVEKAAVQWTGPWRKGSENDLDDRIWDNYDNGHSNVLGLPAPPKTNGGTFKVFGEIFNPHLFEKIVAGGCAFCGSGISWADRLHTRFVDKYTPICESCIRDEAVALFLTDQQLKNLEGGVDVH